VCQVTLGLQVRFTDEWQIAPDKARTYITERSRLLLAMVGILPDAHAKFVGIGFRIHLNSSGTDAEVIERIATSMTHCDGARGTFASLFSIVLALAENRLRIAFALHWRSARGARWSQAT
jgi:hypothetical protein